MQPKENIKSKKTRTRISNNVSRLARKRKTVSVQFLEFICTMIFFLVINECEKLEENSNHDHHGNINKVG